MSKKEQDCLKCGCNLSDLDRIHFGMCSTCFSIECNAPDYPNEEELHNEWECGYKIAKNESYTEIEVLKEVIKGLLPIAENGLHQSACMGYSYIELKTFIETAYKLLNE